MVRKVLLVDDDDISTFLNIELMDRMAFAEETVVATNGQEAHEVLLTTCCSSNVSECHLDLILLDINMPVLDGFGFLEEYGKMDLCCAPKVVLLSSSNHPDDLEKAKQHGLPILTKPLTTENLTIILSELSKVVVETPNK
ncbi:response regulator [Rufibacter tibetensis]|uniref:Response regulatory domain-containing protein n=1 Tax=Rufibacter tibetensis TaxID=512763 RepID=A0A0P0CTZ2_9BACT|nr:response regulator [Rufibacter tibetensis]ALI97757.1 hypothetical protein DC20_00575 [Rufibacter tibetensis]